MLRRPFTQGARARFVVVLLLLTLALTAVLAYEAQTAARSHEAAATSALRDHAAFVAWRFSDHAHTAYRTPHTGISPPPSLAFEAHY